MKIVADTNVIISMLLWGKSLERLFVLINERKVTLCFSPETIDELFRVIEYPHIQKQAKKLNIQVIYLLDKLIALSYICYPTTKVSVVKDDESDNRLIEAALESQIMYMVSGDKHLKKLVKFRNITICTPAQFLKLF